MNGLRTTIEALNRAMAETLKQGNLRDVAQFYAEDGVLIGPYGQHFAGRDAIAAYWSLFDTATDWQLQMLEFATDGSTAYQLARSHITHDIGGEHITGSVDVVLIWKCQPDGSYRICADVYL